MLYEEKRYFPNWIFTVLSVILVQLVIGISVMICNKLGLISDVTPEYFIACNTQTIYVIIYLFILSSGSFSYLKDCFAPKVRHFHWVWISLLLGFLERVIITLNIMVITRLGIDFTVGNNQAASSNLLMDELFRAGILAPLHEEFIFRVLFFAVAAKLVDWCFKKYNNEDVYNLNSKLCWGLIILNACVFSLVHGPNIYNFHMYAIGGLVAAILYLKYGYWAAVLEHFSFNFLSTFILLVLQSL